MNKERRGQIAKAIGLIREAQSILSAAASDEQEAYDNMPEGVQQGERGQRMEEIVSNLNDLDNTLDDVTATAEECCT